jgi:hypothetical protein
MRLQWLPFVLQDVHRRIDKRREVRDCHLRT